MVKIKINNSEIEISEELCLALAKIFGGAVGALVLENEIGSYKN